MSEQLLITAFPPAPSGNLGLTRRALPSFGLRLRRCRRLRGMKQSHVAELAGVDQATVSRWETAEVRLDPDLARELLALLAISPVLDPGLRRLVETSSMRNHVIAEADHRLLVASPGRVAEWCNRNLEGISLWPLATDEIAAAEEKLTALGWWDLPAPEPVELWTGDGDHPSGPIVQGGMIWERLHLGDGTPVRLCTSL